MHRLATAHSGRLPFVAVGSRSLLRAQHLSVQGARVPIRSVAFADAFPGMLGQEPWIVVAHGPFTRLVEEAGGPDPLTLAGVAELIVRGDPHQVVPRLERLGFPASDIVTTDRILSQPNYVAAQSSLRVLGALGLGAGVLSIMALELYLQVRQRERGVANALALRMGLSQAGHFLAVTLELAMILTTSCLLALGGGFLVAMLTHTWINPLPDVPPSPLLHLPLLFAPGLLAAALVLALSGAGVAQWSAQRLHLGELMRRVG